VLCIAGGIILRWRDTKTGAMLWQVPQQWWELCQKVVYGVYIKWQYTWFVIYSGFFINSPSELTFWIAYVHTTYPILFVIYIILHRKEEHFDGGLGVVMLLENLCFPLPRLFKPSMKIQHNFLNKSVCLLLYRIWQTIVRLLVFLY